jgi:dienelactone hydrolase
MIQPFDYDHDGLTLRGQLALPAGPGPHPGIMVMHDGQGVSEFMCAKAQSLAALGFAALATDMFGGGRRPADLKETMGLVMPLRQDEPLLRRRVVASFEAFRAHAAVDATRVGAIGYCFGGQCVLELARSGAQAKGVVSFHGVLASGHPSTHGAVKARVLVLTGSLDPFAPPRHVEAFQEEMRAAGAEWHMTIYGGAKHGFTDPVSDAKAAEMDGVGYDALADRLSWAQALAFLDATVRSPHTASSAMPQR